MQAKLGRATRRGDPRGLGTAANAAAGARYRQPLIQEATDLASAAEREGLGMRVSGPVNRTAIACLAVLGLLSAAACDPGWGTTRSHRVDNLSGQSWIVMGAVGDSVVAYSANMPAHSTISAVFPSSVTELTIEFRSPSCELVATLDVSADVARIVIDSDGHISTPTSGERSSSTLQDLGSTFGTPILC